MFSYIFKYRERSLFLLILMLWIFACNTNLLPIVGIDLSYLVQEDFPIFPNFKNTLETVPYLSKGLFFLILFVQAWFINNLVKTHQLTKNNSNLPAIVYVLLVSVLNESYILHPAFVACTFVILSLNSYLKSYNNRTFIPLFDTAFYIGLASVIYPPASLLLITVFFAHFFYRRFNPKEWFTSLIGFVVTWYLCFVLFYLIDYWWIYQKITIDNTLNLIGMPEINGFGQFVFLAFLIWSIFFGFYHYQRRYLRIPIEQRDKLSICVYFLLASLGLSVIFGEAWQIIILFSLPSLAIFIGYGLYYTKNKKLAELLPLTLFIVVIFLHHFSEYFSFFNYFNS